MHDIPVLILVVINLVKTRAFETFHSKISSNNIIEFDGAAVADYLGLPELWLLCFYFYMNILKI